MTYCGDNPFYCDAGETAMRLLDYWHFDRKRVLDWRNDSHRTDLKYVRSQMTLTVGGVTRTLEEWERQLVEYEITADVLYNRLHEQVPPWTPEDAVTVPKGKWRRRK